MSLSREQMLVEMGVAPLWVRRDAVAATATAAQPATLAAAPSETGQPVVQPAPPPVQPASVHANVQPVPLLPVGGMDWSELSRQVAGCRACALGAQRRQAVFGVGDQNPDWLFIGEGPGAEEDAQGEPFVGQAGKLLDNMLASLAIARGNKVYIANAVKCRPPGNRTPEAGEMAACRPYLERQIALLKPKIIVLLGKAAVHAVLHDDKSLASMRGKRFEYAGIPIVVTYHPAYLLRNLPDKAKAWEDLLFARRVLAERTAPELPF
jgi:DNA polymerase